MWPWDGFDLCLQMLQMIQISAMIWHCIEINYFNNICITPWTTFPHLHLLIGVHVVLSAHLCWTFAGCGDGNTAARLTCSECPSFGRGSTCWLLFCSAEVELTIEARSGNSFMLLRPFFNFWMKTVIEGVPFTSSGESVSCFVFMYIWPHVALKGIHSFLLHFLHSFFSRKAIFFMEHIPCHHVDGITFDESYYWRVWQHIQLCQRWHTVGGYYMGAPKMQYPYCGENTELISCNIFSTMNSIVSPWVIVIIWYK